MIFILCMQNPARVFKKRMQTKNAGSKQCEYPREGEGARGKSVDWGFF